jgi:hypothetical protein
MLRLFDITPIQKGPDNSPKEHLPRAKRTKARLRKK